MRNDIRAKVKNRIGYKSPEQLALLVGIVGIVEDDGKVELHNKYVSNGEITVGRLNKGLNGKYVIIKWEDDSFDLI
tara:strand:- start:360 stop:587 length:228 start_codon:yes stop_codon:yes gene_type:complete